VLANIDIDYTELHSIKIRQLKITIIDADVLDTAVIRSIMLRTTILKGPNITTVEEIDAAITTFMLLIKLGVIASENDCIFYLKMVYRSQNI
jgi:hypothetical protein